MRNRLWIVALTALLLQACATSNSTPEQPVEPVEPAYVPVAGLSAKERFRESLRLLAEGDAVAARAELVLYRQDQPGSEIAADLIDQIDTPASIYFPEEYQEVSLDEGVSLSSLSRQYLGSVYKFHALAKYNGIVEPHKLHTGQAIRIPLTDSARVAFANADKPAAPAPEAVEEDYTEPMQPIAEEPVDSQVQDAAPAEPAVDTTAKVEDLHRQAMNAYHGQDLDRAIALWDEVLAIDPDHRNAQIYRSQAQSLKKKLSNLN